jgi:DNA-binding CsgD family transcriptional regulator/energy-coupling factor transporter ATP-binding protein EcfA2
VADDAAEPLTAAIVGPGGCGKSALLKAVSAAYERAGGQVLHVERDTDVAALSTTVPVLVDDAHRLSSDVLGALRAFARSGGARMLVTYRPWPRPDGLSALGAQLSRHHSPVVLGHLSRDETVDLVARRVKCQPPESFVALVHEQSGGSPLFAGMVTQALVDTGRFDPRQPDRFRRPARVSVSPGLAERLRYLLEALDQRIYLLLEALALGAALEQDVLGALLEADSAELTDTVEAARATGLLTESGDLIVFVRNLVLRLMPVLRARNIQRRLAEIQLANGGPVLTAGRQLAEAKATGAQAAQVLAAAADEALRSSPRLATELFDAAVRAGGSTQLVTARRAQAAALAGDPAQALRLADETLTADGTTSADRRLAVSVTAAVLAQRGFPGRTAELYQGLGGTDALLAVPALLAMGDLDRARAVLAAAPPSESDAPTLTAPAVRLLATGMLATVDGDLPTALSDLTRAACLLEPAGESVLLPYSPAELLALVAAQCGEVALADATLGNAVAAKVGGGLAHAGLLLLHGWNAMARGTFDTARDILDRVRAPLEPVDEVLSAGLAAGLARRTEDVTALAEAFARGRTALIRHPVDLYLLRPLGELAIAAAVAGELPAFEPYLTQARTLLTKLGDPPLWAASLHWSVLQAALAAGDVARAQEEAAALRGLATPHVRQLAAAATCWAQLADGTVDAAAVRAAALGLGAAGLDWDGAQLAATAAARTDDRKVAAELMASARSLSDSVASTRSLSDSLTSTRSLSDSKAEAPMPEPDQAPEHAPLLSERELEVGRLILAGLTHKQIGARLFISAKTVEHHVARMKSRLGADGRNELFGRLRKLFEDESK